MHRSLPLNINTDYHLRSNSLPLSSQIKAFQDAFLQKTKVLIHCIVSKGSRWLRHTFAVHRNERSLPKLRWALACISSYGPESFLVAKSCGV